MISLNCSVAESRDFKVLLYYTGAVKCTTAAGHVSALTSRIISVLSCELFPYESSWPSP